MHVLCSTRSHTITTSASSKPTSNQQSPSAPPQLTNHRRAFLAASLFLAGGSAANALPIPPPPETGGCTDCIGVVNDTLNTCSLSSQSCISTLNDDEFHFVPPWQFDSSPEEAAQKLVEVATGGYYDPGLIDQPFGIKRSDAAGYIAKGVFSVMTNQDMPARPKSQRGEFVALEGVLVERKTTDQGALYVRLILGVSKDQQEVEDPANVIDAEFLFFPNDNIVNVRASSRAEPIASTVPSAKDLKLSFTSGVVVDRNIAQRKMEILRKALRWEFAPVITDFNPSFNANAPMWFEKLFLPFDERNEFKPSGEAYPTDDN